MEGSLLNITNDGIMTFGGLADTSFAKSLIQLLLFITIISLVPSLLIVVTSFTRIVVVFSLLRTALGLQQSPPSNILIALALFLTGFVMTPTLKESYNNGIKPLFDEQISYEEAYEKIALPFKKFMVKQVRPNDLELFINLSNFGEDDIEYKEAKSLLTEDLLTKTDPKIENIPLTLLVPAFILGELRRAFEIGFLIFVPFLIIDMAVASVLMAMGMMMLPPVVISLPFKLIFFVLIDGWTLLSESLVKSFQ